MTGKLLESIRKVAVLLSFPPNAMVMLYGGNNDCAESYSNTKRFFPSPLPPLRIFACETGKTSAVEDSRQRQQLALGTFPCSLACDALLSVFSLDCMGAIHLVP